MDDERILDLFFARDDRAVTEVTRKYGRGLGQLAFNMLGRAEDAEECVSDTYFAAWNSIPPKRPEYLFAYLSKICRNLALDRLRYIGRKKRAGVVLELSGELEQCIADSSNEREHESREIARAISGFLKEQPEEVREVFIRRYYYSESIRQIAKVRRCGESRIKTMLFRTRAELKAYLENEEIFI